MTASAQIEIAGRPVGPGHPCFVIAEAGVNHNGELPLALALCEAAKEAGADAVKFQTFEAARLVSGRTPLADYQQQTVGHYPSQLEMLRALELDEAAHRALIERCGQLEIRFLSSPFDEGSCDRLEALGVPAFKLGSGELTNRRLLAHVAGKGKPLILSTGMATEEEIAAALALLENHGAREVALLRCVSSYPAPPAEANLRAIQSLAQRFGRPVGFSDHTQGIEVSLAAVAVGACIVEKHLTLDRALPGPDHRASSAPDEMARLVRGIRLVESALGDGAIGPSASERSNRVAARRSLVVARAVERGEALEPSMLTALRP
ncbi:MAG: N-acetylneuraminate synthase family protein, partial [Myxococcales bacterium]|nr:N-acetylneuraminate synthase family protein [Myxococcales bacterium]